MDYDVIIIGAGPAGYVAAIRAGQTGLKTLLIEKENLGGMCLNWGCIPTKTFLETAKLLQKVKKAKNFGIKGLNANKVALDWKQLGKRAQQISTRLIKGIEFLMKKNGVEIIKGEAIIKDQHTISVNNRRITAQNLIIATGSVIKNLDIAVPEGKIVEVKNLLQLKEIPPKIVVYGNNAHAVELAQFFALSGYDSTLLFKELLMPGVDKVLVEFIQNRLSKDGVKLIQINKDIVFSEDSFLHEGKEIPYDLLINAAERTANIPFSDIALPIKDGFISTNQYFQAGYDNIFAIGDVNGKSYLAHAASAQGLNVINVIYGVKNPLDLKKIPINIYTQPEMAQIGLTEEEVKEKGIEYKVAEFPLSANAKSLIEDDKEGKIRLISDTKYGEVLGVQVIAPNATDMIAEAGVLIEMEGTIFDVARVIHAHPTISEIFMEAGFEAIDKAIHK